MNDLSKSIFNVDASLRGMTLRTGSLLVADPSIDEPLFNHAVVSVVDCSDSEGVLGLVMNTPTGHTLDEVIDGVDPRIKIPLYCGGPIGLERLVVLHQLGDNFFNGSKQYSPGLYIGGDINQILNYVNSGFATDGLMRFFVGYCGWTNEQLGQEIADGCWAIAKRPDDVAQLFTTEDEAYWYENVRRLGDNFRSWLLFPSDLMAN